MAKNYWKTKKGRTAIQQAAASDVAGAMRVSPASSGSSSIGSSIGRAPDMGVDPRVYPSSPLYPMTNRVVSQGQTTGFGSFRSTDTGMSGSGAGGLEARGTGGLGGFSNRAR